MHVLILLLRNLSLFSVLSRQLVMLSFKKFIICQLMTLLEHMRNCLLCPGFQNSFSQSQNRKKNRSY